MNTTNSIKVDKMNASPACRLTAAVLLLPLMVTIACTLAPEPTSGDDPGSSENAAPSVAALNPATGILTVTHDRRVAIYDVATGTKLSSFDGETPYRGKNGDTIFGVRSADESATVILAADGASRTVVGQHQTQTNPVLSPDGSLVAMHFQQDLLYQRSNVGTLIYRRDGMADRRRGAQFPLARGELGARVAFFIGCEAEDWTPDGRLVATCDVPVEARPYLTEGSEKWLCISNAEFDKLLIIDRTLSGTAPIISPDGQQLAFVHRDNVWVANIDGSKPRQVTAGGYLDKPRGPAWSPDGKWLAVQGDEGVPDRTGGHVVTNLYLVSSTADNQKLITKILDADGVPIRTDRERASWR